jgi:beta-phosphoglucomutase-like phosphatase (HAD superfamily)
MPLPALENLDALIFDCDGTLLDTFPVYHRAYNHALHAFGGEMPIEWYRKRNGMSEGVLLDEFQGYAGLILDHDEVVRLMRAAFLASLGEICEIDAVTAVARAHKGKLKMAVASGGSREIVSASLDAADLTDLFDTIVTIDDVGKAKPEPDLFLEAARRLMVDPCRCLVFEDSNQGLEAARRAGMGSFDVRHLRASI